MAGRLRHLPLIAILVWLQAAQGAAASPPVPLPNPDSPAFTPVVGPPGPTVRAVGPTSDSCQRMRKQVRTGNSRPALMVRDLATGKRICSLNPKATRSLASNTKLFTTSTAFGRLGKEHRMRTRLLADAPIGPDGVLDGNLFLKGGGDPSLGVESFLGVYFGGGGTDIADLAIKARKAGLKEVTGRLYADETVFDSLRGVADSGFATSPYIGPLSGLSINTGYTSSKLSSFSGNPARLAARSLVRELRGRSVAIRPEIALRKAPRSIRSRVVAELKSPGTFWMSRITNVYSNNFFAEMMLKAIGAHVSGKGSTSGGADVVRAYSASLGSKVSPVDGSGLKVSNRSTAEEVVDLLSGIRRKPWYGSFRASLPLAGREGTVAGRMRGSTAEGRCRLKTGTLTGVSALSGYCRTRSGRQLAVSVLMNGVSDTYAARAAQDRIAAIAAGP